MSREASSFADVLERVPDNRIVFGIDVRPGYDRAIDDPLEAGGEQDLRAAAETMRDFAVEKLDEMERRGVFPAAVKFNRGSWAQLDGLEGFYGQEALREVIAAVRERTDSAVILDTKDGDIGPTARAYAVATFNAWDVDAVTAHTEMGRDSTDEFFDVADAVGGGVFCLARTSNPGAAQTQGLYTVRPDGTGADLDDLRPYYERVAEMLADAAGHDRDGTVGAVVGATTLDELADILSIFMARDVAPPLLLPGVGDQGAEAADVYARAVDDVGYPERRVLIHSASGQTYRAAKDGRPRDEHAEASVDELERLIAETGGR